MDKNNTVKKIVKKYNTINNPTEDYKSLLNYSGQKDKRLLTEEYNELDMQGKKELLESIKNEAEYNKGAGEFGTLKRHYDLWRNLQVPPLDVMPKQPNLKRSMLYMQKPLKQNNKSKLI